MRLRRLAVAVTLVAAPLALGEPAAAQELPLGLEHVDVSDHPDVRLTVSLPPALAGTEVVPADFTVTEAGRRAEAVVTAVDTDRLDVVVLLDTSGSMAGAALLSAKGAAATFVEDLPPGVGVALVAFGAEATVVSAFGEGRDAAAGALAALPARGETALYDGVVVAAGILAEREANRRVVVTLSDGGDTVSTGSLAEARRALATAGATFYAIELQTPENAHEPLATLSDATGGRVVPADDPTALTAIFDELAAAIVNRYEIEFVARGFDETDVAVAVAAAGATAAVATSLRYPPRPVAVTPEEDVPPPPPPAPAPMPVAEPPPPVTPTPPPTVEVVLGWLASGQSLTLGLAALFVGMLGLAWYLQKTGSRVRLAAGDARAKRRTSVRESAITSLTTKASAGIERVLEWRGRRGQLARTLEAAGISLRVGEFLVIVLAGAFAAFVAGYVVGAPTLGVALAGAVAGAAYFVVLRKATARREAFAEQLFPTLQLISGSLRAGFGLMQAIEVVAEESPSPTGDEFHRVKVESHLGRDLDEALEAMTDRVASEDFELVVEAIQIHRVIGGDLGEIIDRVADTIRERSRLKGQVKALSAEGRMSALILTVLPLGMAGFLTVTNPSYIGELTSTTPGRIALAVGAMLMVIGIAWLRRLLRLDY